jgi:hypothetical protein
MRGVCGAHKALRLYHLFIFQEITYNVINQPLWKRRPSLGNTTRKTDRNQIQKGREDPRIRKRNEDDTLYIKCKLQNPQFGIRGAWGNYYTPRLITF